MKKTLLLVLIAIAPLTYAQNGLDFDGIDDVVQTTFSGVLGPADRTFEAWIYQPTASTTNECILDYGLNMVGSRNTLSVGGNNQLVYISGGTNANMGSNANDIPVGQWTHIAFVLDSGTGYMYVNGIQVATSNLSTVNTPTAGVNLRIGERITGGSIPFSGKIDEVRIWDVARTSAELLADMNTEYCGVLPANLVVYYKANQGIAGGSNTSETTLIDDGPVGYDGVLTNFALSGITSNWVTGAPVSAGGTSSTIAETSCFTYTAPSGAVYDSTGMYTDIIPNSAGCDSVITINLTINDVSVDVTQDFVNNTLTADQAGAQYQWLNCGQGLAPVPGATSQTFAPTNNGTYAVEVTLNGCADSSSCFTVSTIGLNEHPDLTWSLYPNPAKDQVSIDLPFDSDLTLLDVSGKVILSKQLSIGVSELSVFGLPAGYYPLQIRNEKGTFTKKLIVQ